MKRKIIYFLIPLSFGLVLGLLVAVKLDLIPSVQSQIQQGAAAQPQGERLEGSNIEDAVINVAKTAGKAVVSISTEHTERYGGGTRRFYFNTPFEGAPFEDDTFRRFFDDFFGDMPEREYKQRGLGSGVIIDSEGYILTNEHVISGADKITVTLSDGREFKAQLKGTDPRSDLAIIKINSGDLPNAKLGSSDELKIGQWVVAIGNPYAFALQNPEPTVTVGVISALHRSLGRAMERNRDYSDLIQTDAAINPGNSGGPLVNLKGQIIGINVAIFSTSGGYQGIGFAIPVNTAKQIIDRLIAGKKILYGWLGVTAQDIDDNLVGYFGLLDKNGVLIGKVLEKSPAEKAGMKSGDIIKSFDNRTIGNVRELLSTVGKAQVGKKVKATVIRDKKEVTLSVEIGERPQDLEKIAGEEEVSPEEAWRGIKVADLTPETIRRYRVEGKEGVAITDVEAGSAADDAGLMRGEVIVEINKQSVNNVSDYNRITAGVKSDALVRTRRGFFVVRGER
jgi:serine protease Do